MSTAKSCIIASPSNGFVWIEGIIDAGSYRSFRAAFRSVSARVGVMPIVIYMTGPGGSDSEMTPMFDCIERSSKKVITVAHGQVNSATFLLTQSGHVRCATPGARFMFHKTIFMLGTGTSPVEVNDHVLRQLLVEIQQSDAESLVIFARRGRPLKELGCLLQREAVIGLNKARSLNLIDEVYPRDIFQRHRRTVRQLQKQTKRLSR